MLRRAFATGALLGAVALVTGGCAAPMQSQGVGDTAEHHYAIGMKMLESAGLLDTGEEFREVKRRTLTEDYDPIKGAAEEFVRARKLAPDDPRAYEGMGMIAMLAQRYDKAQELFETSRGKSSKYVPAYMGLARAYAGQGKLDRAKEAADAAVRLDPRNARTHVLLGRVLLASYEFTKAEAAFAKALELAPADPVARREWDRSVKIRQAAPGTMVGKRIALADPMTRGELAALLATELNVESQLRKKRPEIFDPSFRPPGEAAQPAKRLAPTDVARHWARNAIELVTRLNLMDTYPDGSFKPDEAVTRTDLAVTLEQVVSVIVNDPAIKTRHVGQTSPFPDVRGDHFAFNAIMLTTTRGLMEAERASGAFRLTQPVTGPEALLSMRKLAELF